MGHVGHSVRSVPAALLCVAFLAMVALAGCAGPKKVPDKDGDNIPDGDEGRGWSILVDLLGRRVGRPVTSDPALADTDRDGLRDDVELGLGLDPRSADTDEDGLSDCQEELHKVRAQCEDPAFDALADGDGGYDTDPKNADSDRGASRYLNEALGFEDTTGTVVTDTIPWGDGIPDGQELGGYEVHLVGFSRLVTTDPLSADSDEDGLEDGEERFLYRADPQNPDTDGDGCEDGYDPWPDARERYGLGLANLTYLGAGTARLQFVVVWADQTAQIPAAGHVEAASGQPVDASALDPGALPPATCSFPPHDGRSNLQMLLYDVAGPAPRALDFTSQTLGPIGSGEVAIVQWDLRTGTLRIPDGLTLPNPLVLEGADASIELRPHTVKP